MQKLIVEKVGSIERAELSLKRFNFLIGPQSSGKSTIAKIISTCRWIEKEVVISGDTEMFASEDVFLSQFVPFHKMRGYFGDGSIIHYSSDYITIDFSDHIPSVSLGNRYAYRRQKICYIPSERNAVVLPELQGIELGPTNLRDFLFDWFSAREFYVETNKSDILNLGVKYFYNPDESRPKDLIQHSNGLTYQIPLSDASSGLQSVIPLKIMLEYYTGQYFEASMGKYSYKKETKNRQIARNLYDELVMKKLFPEFDPVNADMSLYKDAVNRINHADAQALSLREKFMKIYENFTVPAKTSFIVEEPEQNLFPDTQTDLLEYMVSICGKQHDLTVTTHSPYLLNQLNLLFKSFDNNASIGLDFDEVSVYAIMDGRPVDLKLGNAHLVNPEHLSEPLDRIYDKYETYGR